MVDLGAPFNELMFPCATDKWFRCSGESAIGVKSVNFLSTTILQSNRTQIRS